MSPRQRATLNTSLMCKPVRILDPTKGSTWLQTQQWLAGLAAEGPTAPDLWGIWEWPPCLRGRAQSVGEAGDYAEFFTQWLVGPSRLSFFFFALIYGVMNLGKATTYSHLVGLHGVKRKFSKLHRQCLQTRMELCCRVRPHKASSRVNFPLGSLVSGGLFSAFESLRVFLFCAQRNRNRHFCTLSASTVESRWSWSLHACIIWVIHSQLNGLNATATQCREEKEAGGGILFNVEGSVERGCHCVAKEESHYHLAYCQILQKKALTSRFHFRAALLFLLAGRVTGTHWMLWQDAEELYTRFDDWMSCVRWWKNIYSLSVGLLAHSYYTTLYTKKGHAIHFTLINTITHDTFIIHSIHA